MTRQPDVQLDQLAHSSRGASGAHRWMKCLGQPQLVERLIAEGKIPEHDESNPSAQRGTAAHKAVELCLSDGTDPQFFEGVELAGVELEEEDVDAVRVCLDYIQEIRASGEGFMFTEARFNLRKLHPLLFGTSDVVLVLGDYRHLKVIDYKHGVQVPVEVEGNKQLLYYTLGAINYVDETSHKGLVDLLGWGYVFDTVEITVVQPRCHHADGPLRPWSPTPAEINDFAQELGTKAAASTVVGAPLVAGDHCRWCRAIGNCPERDKSNALALKTEFDGVSDPVNLTFPPVASLTIPELSKMMRFAPLIKEFLKAASESVLFMLKQGKEVPGFKLVKKKANRQWNDDPDLLAKLGSQIEIDDAYEPKKLKSPAQMEKLIDKKIVALLAHKPDTGVTVAPEYDNRPAVSLGPAIEFKE